ncbi:MAG: VOC family protein [Inquilinaceae bacterium]
MTPPCIFPTIRYRDADAAIAWLKDTIGFVEHALYRSEDGSLAHAQFSLGSSIVMVGEARDDDYGRLVGDKTGRRTDALYVAVENLDDLYDKVRATGSIIEMELHDTDYGSREFVCRDPENNLWSFGTYWPKVDS